ncbi:MAG: hypothetical protein IPK04_15840 [Bdellovibrionales bacterium]|nr:hypothetical protein [Bdellovibrionales bacterium]
MIKKQFALKKVHFGSRWHQAYKLIHFETFSSYLQRGGKITTTKPLKYQPPARNLTGDGFTRGKVQFSIAS